MERNRKYYKKGVCNGEIVSFTEDNGQRVTLTYVNADAIPFCFDRISEKVEVGRMGGYTHRDVLAAAGGMDNVPWEEIEDMDKEDICYEAGVRWDDLINGRLWYEEEYITFWEVEDTPEWRRYVDIITKLISQKTLIDFSRYKIVSDCEENGTVLVCPVQEFIHPTVENVASDDVVKARRNKYEWDSAEREGWRKYNDYVKNSPYADERYKFALREKRRITKKRLNEIISRTIKGVIFEEFLYHRGGDIDTNNPEAYHSEGRGSKWAGTGHETGSFGSGTYFTSANPYDSRFSDDELDNIKQNRDNEGRFIRIKGSSGDKSGLYRVDTSFYSNLYELKSEKEGTILKNLMNDINEFVRTFQYGRGDYSYMRDRQGIFLRIKRDCKKLGLNLPWDYRSMCKFAINYCSNNSIIQTPATIFMEKNGYNGVDATYAGKYDSYWEGSVIYDINKVNGDIKPVKLPRNEFNIAYPMKTMYNDILDGKKDSFHYWGDNDKDILSALKRYPMVLSNDKFFSLPENIKSSYLKILLNNIRNGFINLKDRYSNYHTYGLGELKKDYYIESIIKNRAIGFLYLDESLAERIFDELEWGNYSEEDISFFKENYKS